MKNYYYKNHGKNGFVFSVFKLNNILILILLFFVLNSYGQENDIIRHKIENRNEIPLTSFGLPIYCKQYLPTFYQNVFFKAVWTQESARQLLTAISKAGDEGLNPEDYHYDMLTELMTNNRLTDFEKAEFDMLLTDAFMLYVSHLISGKVNPVSIDAEWHVRKAEVDLNHIFTDLSTKNIEHIINGVLPKKPTYYSFKAALKKYRLLKTENWININSNKTIKPGDENENIPSIRKRLNILGDLKDSSYLHKNLYDENLLSAVKNFQARHGINVDGEIGPKTLATMNVLIQRRIEQIEANLERWRWLPREFGNFYIIVNIANFELDVFKNKKQVQNYKVIVGKPYRKTPVFSASMQYLVLNPTWTIPPGILTNDVLPGVRKDVNYLKTKKIEVTDNQGKTLDASTINWNDPIVKSYTYRQPPGPENSLGAVKFMFPNSFSVYLHDTPSKALFQREERAFSSGCIRVSEPLKLAEYLLNDSVNYNFGKLKEIVKTNITQTIKLKEKPDVFLLYWTAWTDSAGKVNFRQDIYNRDEVLIKALSQSSSETIN